MSAAAQKPAAGLETGADLSDSPRHECGVFAVFGAPDMGAARLAYLGLYALQHRGQESAGIAVSDGRQVRLHKGMGLVPEVFDEPRLRELPGHLAIGHVRYSTTGSSQLANAQPLLVHTSRGPLAVAHNGDLINARQLREELQRLGSVFQTTSDSEVIVNLIARHSDVDLPDAVARCMEEIQGGYAVVAMTRNELIAFRDPWGIRPLCWGQADGLTIVASESCALSALGVEEAHDVPPGALVVVGPHADRTVPVLGGSRPALCAFEFIYFSRPDSELSDRNVHLVRKAIGRELYREHPVQADVVIAAPDSGTSAAMGFAEASRIPFEIGLVKNRYVGRTFIQPQDALRHMGVKIKLNPVRAVLRDRRVVVIDDSIVRGTTSRRTVSLIREAGAREVHMYVASPPFRHPCHYGIDISDAAELIAANRTVDEIRRYIGADSLHFLSLEGLCRAIGISRDGLCLACMNGEYPTPLPDPSAAGKLALEAQPLEERV